MKTSSIYIVAVFPTSALADDQPPITLDSAPPVVVKDRSHRRVEEGISRNGHRSEVNCRTRDWPGISNRGSIAERNIDISFHELPLDVFPCLPGVVVETIKERFPTVDLKALEAELACKQHGDV